MHAGWLSVLSLLSVVLDSQEPLHENGDTHGGMGLPVSTPLDQYNPRQRSRYHNTT